MNALVNKAAAKVVDNLGKAASLVGTPADRGFDTLRTCSLDEAERVARLVERLRTDLAMIESHLLSRTDGHELRRRLKPPIRRA